MLDAVKAGTIHAPVRNPDDGKPAPWLPAAGVGQVRVDGMCRTPQLMPGTQPRPSQNGQPRGSIEAPAVIERILAHLGN